MWAHVIQNVLFGYIINSVFLLIIVGLGIAIIGISTSYTVTKFEFRGRKLLEFLLILPLAAPPYVVALTYAMLLDYPGPVQSFLREHFGWANAEDYWFPHIRSLGGIAFVFTFIFYPYVYLLLRTAFIQHYFRLTDASRLHGRKHWQTFWQISLPLARPALVIGVALGFMEVLSAAGTFEYYGVQTLVTGVVRLWMGYGDVLAGAQVASVLLLFIMAITWVEKRSRQKIRYYQKSSLNPAPRQLLTRKQTIWAWVVCMIPITFGFLIPLLTLLWWSLPHESMVKLDYWLALRNSFMLALTAGFIIVLFNFIMAYAAKHNRSKWFHMIVKMGTFGYAVPGTVLAIGIFMPIIVIPNLRVWLDIHAGIHLSDILNGTIFALILAYLVRFSALAFHSSEEGFAAITPTLEGAARTLGAGPWETLRRLHSPLMMGTLSNAFLMVFIEVIKELPATMLLKPYNFGTLALKTYEYAYDERLAEAAPFALSIVVLCCASLIFMTHISWRAQIKGNDS